jgi:hypothetical protein
MCLEVLRTTVRQFNLNSKPTGQNYEVRSRSANIPVATADAILKLIKFILMWFKFYLYNRRTSSNINAIYTVTNIVTEFLR